MPLLNYTSEVDPDVSAQNIAKCLSKHGARAVLTEYDPNTKILTSISFKIALNGNDISFRLPCNPEPVFSILTKERNLNHYKDPKYRERLISNIRLQSIRTAWKIVHDWVQAQMALVETQMVTTTEVFLPYAVMKNGKTLAEGVIENPQLLLN